MKELSQEIIDYIASYGGTPEELTPEEIAEVISEFEAKKKGNHFLDGVLVGRFPQYR